jgi:hypothetical protein
VTYPGLEYQGYEIYQNGTGTLVGEDSPVFEEWDVYNPCAVGDSPAATEAGACMTMTGCHVESDYPSNYLSS